MDRQGIDAGQGDRDQQGEQEGRNGRGQEGDQHEEQKGRNGRGQEGDQHEEQEERSGRGQAGYQQREEGGEGGREVDLRFPVQCSDGIEVSGVQPRRSAWQPPAMPSGQPPAMPSGQPPAMPSGQPPAMPSGQPVKFQVRTNYCLVDQEQNEAHARALQQQEEIRNLQLENERLRRWFLCRKCHQSRIQVALVPCGHPLCYICKLAMGHICTICLKIITGMQLINDF